ncbi:MAG: hypothetical protein EOM24_27305 [Chloroflexia bacterium]|nr:hypothetical protein [Chloroflexia bacterium]
MRKAVKRKAVKRKAVKRKAVKRKAVKRKAVKRKTQRTCPMSGGRCNSMMKSFLLLKTASGQERKGLWFSVLLCETPTFQTMVIWICQMSRL